MTDTTDPTSLDETPDGDYAPTTSAQRQRIETIFRTSYPNLVSYAMCVRASTREDAEDAVQHAFEKVLAGHRCLADPDATAVRRLNALPERQRQVFVLRLQGYSYAQIAAILTISKSTVNGHMVRALATMRDGLGDWLTEEQKKDKKPDPDTHAADTVEDDR
ncbi:MAG TPA: sigma factor-like helix-turn-helix DNA-binding protein [Gemmatimonadaceae bacterium]|jgi:DNA-directed RNA polymerase specialized sigma24 family protein|nr:sigma factor-like helix-turn-helix DNA-binding protein [Gemmatimonadaceae bacterium]